MSYMKRLLIACAIATLGAAVALPGAAADPVDEYEGKPEQAIIKRFDRFKPRPPGTKEKMRYWFGPYPTPPGWDSNRVDVDIPLQNGFIISVEPGLRRVENLTEPAHQSAHIHHAHWFRVDPGNREDNYLYGNGEWIFGTGDEETKADFSERSAADPNGPIYGQYISAGGPQAMIYMLHNKTSAVLNAYIVLDVTFVHGTHDQLKKAGGRAYHDITGALFGRTFDVPRQADGDGKWSTTSDHSKGAIEFTSSVDGTMIGTGSHMHPGGLNVLTENMGSKDNPCANDGKGTGGTLLLNSRAVWNKNVPFSEDFQMEVTNPAWRAPIHKGDRIRITGFYENKDHAWYTAMTHNGLYIDEAQKPQGRCKPYLINQPAPGMKTTKVKKRKLMTTRKTVRNKKTGQKWVKVSQRYKTTWVTKRERIKPVEITAGVLNRPWTHHVDNICGTQFGALDCNRPERPRPPGIFTDTVTIANFLYLPGDMSLGDANGGAPPRIKTGKPLTFLNVDQALGIRHSVTTCEWPCNGPYVANYPLANGAWDSGTMGFDLIDGGSPNPLSQTPANMTPGKYSYFCRIHPWMRGVFEVVQ